MTREHALARCNLYARIKDISKSDVWRAACLYATQADKKGFSQKDRSRLFGRVQNDIEKFYQTGAIPEYIVEYADFIDQEYLKNTGHKFIEEGDTEGAERWKRFEKELDKILRRGHFHPDDE